MKAQCRISFLSMVVITRVITLVTEVVGVDDLPELADHERQEFIQDFVTNHYSSNSGFLYSNSPIHAMHLARLDRLIYSQLKEYQVKLQKRLELIRVYLEDFEENSLRPDLTHSGDPENWHWAVQISSNPISAVRLLRRMTQNLPSVLENIESGHEVELIDTIFVAKDRNRLDWPSERDLEVITQSLLDIPIVYDLPVKQIADGSFYGEPSLTLTTAECNEIAATAFRKNRLASAIHWMNAAWNRFQVTPTESIPEDLLEFNRNNAIEEHDAELLNLTITQVSARRPLSYFWDHDLFINKVTGTDYHYNGLSLRHLHEMENSVDKVHPTVHFWRLCGGVNFQSQKEVQFGHCFYSYRTFLVPLKVEILNRFPLILQIHNLLDPSTSLTLITEAMGQIEYLNGVDNSLLEKDARPPIPATLDIGTMTKFESNMKLWKELIQNGKSRLISERLHVSVFSFANSDASLDRFPESGTEVDEGQSTLNIHLFLNTVDNGGRTAFPRLGFAVKPERNSALIWSQFKLNGVPHPDLFWINCPLVSGNKWVASSYVHSVGTGLGFGSGILNRLKH